MIDEWLRQAQASKDFEANLKIIAANGGEELAQEMLKQGPKIAGAQAAALAHEPTDVQKAAIAAHAAALGAGAGTAAAVAIASPENQAKANAAWKKLIGGIGAPASVPTSVYPGGSASGLAAPAPAAMVAPAGNVRVYIDGDQLRATVRTDVAAASARAALVGAGRGRP
jgi:hypothetical protein